MPIYFPFFFASLWLAVTTHLGFASGWYSLMKRFPNRDEEPLLTLKRQSGSMGLGMGVSMRNILRLSACPSGLRIGLMRIFGLFCRDIFVPWDEMSVKRTTYFFQPVAELDFGVPLVGRLLLPELAANRLRQVVLEKWPEAGPMRVFTRKSIFWRIFKVWFLRMGLSSAFFIVLPRLVAPPGAWPPVLVAILFPAFIYGVVAIFEYRRQ